MTNRSIIVGSLAYIICATSLLGCEREVGWGKRFDTAGQLRPDFRFTVTLDSEVDTTRLYPVFERIAQENGFPSYTGVPVAKTLARQDGIFAFDWVSESEHVPLRNVSFANEPMANSFKIVLYNNDMDSFQAEDWEVFAMWKNEILPQAFPNATIEVARHPAVFTDEQYLEEFASATGVAIPDSFQASKQ